MLLCGPSGGRSAFCRPAAQPGRRQLPGKGLLLAALPSGVAGYAHEGQYRCQADEAGRDTGRPEASRTCLWESRDRPTRIYDVGAPMGAGPQNRRLG